METKFIKGFEKELDKIISICEDNEELYKLRNWIDSKIGFEMNEGKFKKNV